MSTETKKLYAYDSYQGLETIFHRKEMDELAGHLRSGARVYAAGPRRCGKTTTVLGTLEREKIPCLRIDLDGITTQTEILERLRASCNVFLRNHPAAARRLTSEYKVEAEIGGSLLDVIGLKLRGERVTPASPVQSIDDMLEVVAQVARSAHSPIGSAVIFVDEFQQVKHPAMGAGGTTSPRILGAFASISDPSRPGGAIPFVFAGSNRHAMYTIFTGSDSLFYQRTTNLFIGPLPREDILPFLIKRFGSHVPKEIADDAYTFVEGITGDLQRVFHALRAVTPKGESPTKEHLKHAKKTVLRDLGQTYGMRLQSLSALERKVLDLIADHDIRTIRGLSSHLLRVKVAKPDCQKAIRRLVSEGYLHFASSGTMDKIHRPEPMLFRYLETTKASAHETPEECLLRNMLEMEQESNGVSP